MADQFTPRKEDKFTFGLWTVGNTGRDPFGEPVRAPIAPERIVAKLSELGAYGVNLHDNDLVPFDATPQQRDQIVASFKQALSDHGWAKLCPRRSRGAGGRQAVPYRPERPGDRSL